MSRPRVEAGTDPAAQWQIVAPALGARLSGRQPLVAMLRAVYAPADAVGVADAVLAQLAPALPSPVWALVAAEPSGRLITLAGRDLGGGLGPAAEAVAAWVVDHGQEFVTADLRDDARVSDTTSATVVAFPLPGRDRTVGALVGLAGTSSARPPRPGRRLVTALTTLLEPAAAALDHALQRERLEALSVTDDLTQLYNSRYLNLALRRETKRATRSGSPLSLLFIDLDAFKSVNDRFDHLCGSRTLVEVAAVIRGSARETDVAARFGGDEFAVILPETHAVGAFAVGERVRARIAATRFLEDGPGIRVTASVGVATLPDAVDTAEALVSAADAAMYAVKQSGKNGVLAARRQDEESERPAAPPPVPDGAPR